MRFFLRDYSSIVHRIADFQDRIASNDLGAEEEFEAFKSSRRTLVECATEVKAYYFQRIYHELIKAQRAVCCEKWVETLGEKRDERRRIKSEQLLARYDYLRSLCVL